MAVTDVKTLLIHLVLLLAAIGAVTFLAANGDISGSSAVEVISFAIGATATAGGVTAGARAVNGATAPPPGGTTTVTETTPATATGPTP